MDQDNNFFSDKKSNKKKAYDYIDFYQMELLEQNYFNQQKEADVQFKIFLLHDNLFVLNFQEKLVALKVNLAVRGSQTEIEGLKIDVFGQFFYIQLKDDKLNLFGVNNIKELTLIVDKKIVYQASYVRKENILLPLGKEYSIMLGGKNKAMTFELVKITK